MRDAILECRENLWSLQTKNECLPMYEVIW